MLPSFALIAQMHEPVFLKPQPNEVAFKWLDKTVLTGKAPAGIELQVSEGSSISSVEPLHLGYPHGPKDAQFAPQDRFRLSRSVMIPNGEKVHFTVLASPDSFVCTDRGDAPVGSQIGRVTPSFANGVYDRKADWLITFRNATFKGQDGKGKYSFSASGPDVLVEFRPNYYRDHLGYFLWDKSKPLWKDPVAGWCSWMAYLQKVTEGDVLKASRFFAENLKDYGYDIVQIDDGFQRSPQGMKEGYAVTEPVADLWLKPNEKFPRGMAPLAKDIAAMGITPGIWIGLYLPLGMKHAEGYVTGPDGKPHKGPWVNYAVNGLIKPALEEGYLNAVEGHHNGGWDYFKIDTLRHVLYDSYRQVPDYWKRRGESQEEAFRAILKGIKGKIGRDTYLLACWGVMPEMAGIPDGCRIGEDVGPDFDSMRRTAKYIAQFHYLNNVVWRNDPDYMCLRVPTDQARAWATMTFLSGGHLMVSDPVESYDADRVEILRKVGPPIYSRPINPGSMPPDPEWMTLHAEKDKEEWTVAARFAWADLPAANVPLSKLGLPEGRYLAFDFWNERFLGEVSETAPFGALRKGACQTVSFRKLLDRPQVLGTNRHIGQGVHELSGVKWRQNTLSGKFKNAPGEAWSLYIHVPAGYHVTSTSPLSAGVENGVLKLTFPEGSGDVDWAVTFKR